MILFPSYFVLLIFSLCMLKILARRSDKDPGKTLVGGMVANLGIDGYECDIRFVGDIPKWVKPDPNIDVQPPYEFPRHLEVILQMRVDKRDQK